MSHLNEQELLVEILSVLKRNRSDSEAYSAAIAALAHYDMGEINRARRYLAVAWHAA